MRRDKAAKFLRMAVSHAQEFSKDASTKVGALVVSPDSYEIRSIGYNGQPRGCADDKPERCERPEKYFWNEHAERNAIYNAARVGTRLDGGILVVSLFPCMDCARAVAQTGLIGVVSMAPDFTLPTWGDIFPRSMELFDERSIWTMLLSPDEIISSASEEMRPAFEKWLAVKQK